MIATPRTRRALLYDSLPSFLPLSADTNAFLSPPCALFAQSAFFASFIFNHLRTLLHTPFFSTPFFSTVCALFAEKRGDTPSISVALFLRCAVRFPPPLPDCKFLHFLHETSAIFLLFVACALRTQNAGGVGVEDHPLSTEEGT